MTLEIGLLLALIGVMALLFLTELLPIEVTAFLGLIFLTLGGYLGPAEAFGGFASPAVITMLSVFFLSAALLHTGVADLIGGRVHRLLGDREVVLTAAIMVVAGVLSAFMNNIAAVAVLLPAVASISRRTGVAPSRLFMPLAFGAILGGTMTLVGTPPNILASDLLRDRGLEPFALFDFTPLGAVLLACGVLYMVTVGRWLLPRRAIGEHGPDGESLAAVYHLDESLFSIRIPADSPLDGVTLGESRLGSALDIQVVGVVREGRTDLAPRAGTVLRSGEVLLVKGHFARVREMFRVQGVEIGIPEPDALGGDLDDVGCLAARVVAGSDLEGRTLRDLRFRDRFGLLAIGVRRDGDVIHDEVAAVPLQQGDEVLALGTRSEIEDWAPPQGLEVAERDPAGLCILAGPLFLLRIHAGSELVGVTIRESRMGELVGLTVAGIVRAAGTKLSTVGPGVRIGAGDRLLVVGEPDRVRDLLALGDVQLTRDVSGAGVESDQVGMVEVTLAPRSRAEGKTLAEIDFREAHGVQVLSIWRRGQPLEGHLARRRLRLGDALLVQGSRRRIRRLGANPDFVVLTSDAQEPRRTRRAPVAVAGLALMIGMVASGFQPIHVAAFTAATFVVLLGAITMEEAYRAVEWKAVFLVAAVLPLGAALEQTGAASLLAGAVTDLAGPLGPSAALAGLTALSSLLSQCLDGAPAVVLMAPVVLQSSADLGLGQHAAMMAVSLAASAAFMTPFSHKANLLVMGSGGYRVVDYLRVGTPLTIILLVLLVLLVPVLFPGG